MIQKEEALEITNDIHKVNGRAPKHIYTIKGDKGVFAHLEDKLPEQTKNGERFGWYVQSFLAPELAITLKYLKKEDKLMVNPMFGRVNIHGHFNQEVEPFTVRRRAAIVSGLALVAQCKGTVLHIYRDRQKASDRLARVNHETVRRWLETHMTFTDDFGQDMEESWQQLWFNSPFDLTEKEAFIKRVSLGSYEKLLHRA